MTQTYKVQVSMNQAHIVESGFVWKQGDFGFNIEIEVLDFDTTGATPQIIFRKSTGAVEATQISVAGNKFTYAIRGTELDTPGPCVCDLKLKDSTTKRVSTASFKYFVIPDTMDGLDQEASSYSDTVAQIAEELTNEVEDLVDGINDDIKSYDNTLTKIYDISMYGVGSYAQIINGKWVRGYIDTGTGRVVALNRRVSSENIISYPYDIEMTIETGFQITVAYYNGETYSNVFDANITGKYIIPANKPHRITIRRVTEDSSEVAVIDAFLAKLTVTSIINKEIENTSQEVDAIFYNNFEDLKNIIDWAKIQHQEYRPRLNSFQSNAGYWNTGLLKVKPSTTYISHTISGNANIPLVAFFDQSCTYISQIQTTASFTTPANCYYAILNFRYIHGGVVGTYNDGYGLYGETYDDYIEKLVVNIGTSANNMMPYNDVLNNNKSVINRRRLTNRVVHIENAKRGVVDLIVPLGFTSGTTIKVIGSNIFDGQLGAGYIDSTDGHIIESNTTKYSINNIYVNEHDWIVFSKDCRVTEFDIAGQVVSSRLAAGREPFLTTYGTRYVKFHTANADAEVMYINIGKKITDSAETYTEKLYTINIPEWMLRSFIYSMSIDEGISNIFINDVTNTKISIEYDINIGSSVNSLYDLIDNETFNYRQTMICQSDIYISHRGSTVEAPENTYAAFITAAQNGFKNVEGDIRFTSDNIPVMLHDTTIDRTSNGTGQISSLTYDQVKEYDFGSWFSDKFAGIRIATFENYIKLCSYLSLTPMLDVQGAPNQEQIGILFNIVKRYGLLDKAMWQFYDFTQMSYLTALYDETEHYANVAFNCGPSTVLSDIITGLTWYKYTSGHKINKAIIVLSRTRLTKAFVDECNEKEIDISAYFADSYQEVRELMSVGGHISYITTNGVDLPYYIARNFY